MDAAAIQGFDRSAQMRSTPSAVIPPSSGSASSPIVVIGSRSEGTLIRLNGSGPTGSRGMPTLGAIVAGAYPPPAPATPGGAGGKRLPIGWRSIMQKQLPITIATLAAVLISAAAAAAGPKPAAGPIETTVSASYNQRQAAVQVSLSASKAKCLKDRKIVLQGKGGETEGNAVTNRNGEATIEAGELARGNYGVVARKRPHLNYTCERGQGTVRIAPEALAGRAKTNVKTSVAATFDPKTAKIKVSVSVKKKPRQCEFGREVILKDKNGMDVADALYGTKPTKFDASKLEQGDYTVAVPEKKVKKLVCKAAEASVLVF